MSIITLNDVKKMLGFEEVDTNDAELQGFVDAVTPVLEGIVGPVDVTTVTETFDGGGSVILLKDFNSTVTDISVDGTSLDAGTDYTVDSPSGIVYAGLQDDGCRRFARGNRNVTVTYTTGLAVAPGNLRLAALELVRYWWQLGRQGNRPGFGEAPDSEWMPDQAMRLRIKELIGTRHKAVRYVAV